MNPGRRLCRTIGGRGSRAMRSLTVLLGVAFALVVAAPASAQEELSEEEQKKRAARHFEKGGEYFLDEEYERALDEFRTAYEFYENPMILFNAAVAHGRLGEYDEALETARRAANSGGLGSEARVKNRARMAAWRRIRAAHRGSKRVASATGSSGAPTASGGPSDPGGSGVAARPGVSRSGILSPLGWAGVAVGAVGSGLLAYSGFVHQNLDGDIQSYRRAAQSGDEQAFEERRSTIRSRQSRGEAALYAGVGAVSVAAGLLVWEFVGSRSTETSTVRLDGFGTPERVGLDLSVSFR